MNRIRSTSHGSVPTVAAAVLLLAALGACDSGQVVDPEMSLEIVPDSVTLTHIGQRFAFKVRNGGGPGGGQVSWSSRDTTVFVVDRHGFATARGNGVAYLRAADMTSTDQALVQVRQIAVTLEPFGAGQRAAPALPLLEPVGVRVVDAGDAPASGVVVWFRPEEGEGRVDPATAVTDSLGLASGMWTLGRRPGRQTLRMISADGGARAAITATALEPAEAVKGVEASSGQGQWELPGRTLAEPVVVRLVDASGRPVWGAPVRFEPEAGNGRADPDVAVTDSLGLASAVWTLGEQRGTQRLVARVGELTATFSATAGFDDGVCSRTPAVSMAIAWKAGVGTCAEVTEEALRGIVSLDLEEKNIERLRSGDFAGMPRLRQLDLSRNRLTELPEHAFAGLDSLRSLYLIVNQLEQLPADLFRGLTSLSTLWLGLNQLAELPPGIFAGLGNLSSLSLNTNRLTTLPPGVFEDLASLEYLNLEDNALEQLRSDLFSQTPLLRRIDLSRNRLSELPPGLFSETSALQRLYLQRNWLKVLPPGIFDGLPELFKLVLGRNFLDELPPGIFEGTPKLAELDLIWNSLEKLPRGVFAGLSELKYVNVSGNPGAPFSVRPEFVRVDVADPLAPGPARVVMRVPMGAPLALDIPVSVQRGTSSQDVVSLLPGDTVSAPFVVSGTRSGEAVHIGIGQLPEVTGVGYGGLDLVRGEELVLFEASDNRSPITRSRVRAHRMQSGGPSAQVRIAEYFDDPDGDSLTYDVVTTVSGVVDARIEDGVLWLEPGSVDTTEVEVTATDPGGLRTTQGFVTWVVPAPDPDAFNIELYFEPGFTPEEEATIRRAADRWMEAVTGDLPDVPVQGLFGEYCHASWGPRLVGVVDDVLIRMVLLPSGNFGGFAEICGEREASGLDFVAVNGFHQWYIRNREGYLYEVALHEIGHVLGIGSFGTLESIPDWETDPHFPGPLAVAAFDAAGGAEYSGGKVPLQGPEGPGAYVHWRASVIPDDIMVPGRGTRITAITLQALADLGHEVDVSKADTYTLPVHAQGDVGGSGAWAEGADAELLADDVIEGPVMVVDKDGKVVRVIRR